MDDKSKERHDDYNEHEDALAAGVVTASDDGHYQQHLSNCEADDAMGSKEKDADRVFGFEEYPFEIPSCDHEFTMIDCCNVSRRLHKDYQIEAKSSSIVAYNYWRPLGDYRNFGEYYPVELT